MKSTYDKYEKICTMWEDLGLQNMCAKDAASKLGVSPTTLVMALKMMRPGAYNPNKFKRRKPRVYVYQNCRYCGATTSIRLDISTVDEAENDLEIAKKNAEAIVISAEADAKAMTAKNKAIAANYAIQQSAWKHEETMARLEKWNGKMPGADANTITPNFSGINLSKVE